MQLLAIGTYNTGQFLCSIKQPQYGVVKQMIKCLPTCAGVDSTSIIISKLKGHLFYMIVLSKRILSTYIKTLCH